MSYVIYRNTPGPLQTYNSFKTSTMIHEKAKGDPQKAEVLLSRVYWKAIYTAAEQKKRSGFALLPPVQGCWSWNKSFEIALDVASQYVDDEVHIMIQENADISIGQLMEDMEDSEKAEILSILDFSFDEDGKAHKKDRLQEESSQNASTLLITDDEKKDIDNIISEVSKEMNFSEYLTDKMDQYAMNATDLASATNLMKTTIVGLRDGEICVPSKSQIFAIGIAFQMSLEEMEEMMMIAGYIFSDSVPRDQIVKYYIEKEIYDLTRINKTLFLYDIPTLGTHMPARR